MANDDFDVIVVGSGITGGWAAKELTERGLRVLMLDRGRMIEHGKDYVGEHQAPWDIPYRGNRCAICIRRSTRFRAVLMLSTKPTDTSGITTSSTPMWRRLKNRFYGSAPML